MYVRFLIVGGWERTDEEALSPGEAESFPFIPCLSDGAYTLGRHGGKMRKGGIWGGRDVGDEAVRMVGTFFFRLTSVFGVEYAT